MSKYIEAWPLIPSEELHASSVQHPSHANYRWLLNTRRVPVQPPAEPAAAATERTLPRCAGTGNSEEPVWLCKKCTTALCRPEPVMPFFALANWNWCGRLHPLYYDLSIPMQALLGLAIMVCRLIVLRYSENIDDQEKGLVGNTILLAQPPAEEIIQKLPPPDSEFSKYMSVCFNSQAMTKEDVGKHRALEIDPAQYIECVELRRKVCPVFTEVQVDAEQIRTQWPERAVPTAIVEGAQGMDTLRTFRPTLDGPASMKASTCELPTEDGARTVIDDGEDDAADATERGASHAHTCDHQGAATEHAGDEAENWSLPIDLPAEFLIGVHENDAGDPVDRMLAFQKQLELVQEYGKSLNRLEQRRQEAAKSKSDEVAEAAAELAAGKAQHNAALVQLRSLAKDMGSKYRAHMEQLWSAAQIKDADSNNPKTLHIKSGKPVNMFKAAAWPAAFVQFFYGDCAPNLDRPQRVGVRELFYYLSTREELEYSLDSDKNNPLIPGGCYRAPAQSRWNTPEFMAVFADVVRKMRILQSTNPMWSSNSEKWAIDIKEICEAKLSDFEQLASILARSGQQSMSEMMRAAAEHKLLPLFKALQYLTFQTANIPLTQGYKSSLRQLGFALNVYDGPLTVLLTTNLQTCIRRSQPPS